MSRANTDRVARVNALFERVQRLPRDYPDHRGALLAHFFGALEAMAEDVEPCPLERVLNALDRSVTQAEKWAGNCAILPAVEKPAGVVGQHEGAAVVSGALVTATAEAVA